MDLMKKESSAGALVLIGLFFIAMGTWGAIATFVADSSPSNRLETWAFIGFPLGIVAIVSAYFQTRKRNRDQ